MKKTIFMTMLLLMMVGVANAQVERNKILKCAKGEMTYTEPVKQKETASKVVNNILGSVLLGATGQNNDTKDKPEYAQAVMEAIMGAVGTAHRLVATETDCEYYVDAAISSITSTTRTRIWEDSNKKKQSATEYRGNVTGVVNIRRADTGKIVYTHNINSSSWTDSWFGEETKAMGYVVSNVKTTVRRALNNAYPLHASIVEGARATKSKEKEVYIDLGQNFGCKVDMHFYVYTVKTVAGKEAKKQIGQLKVTEVMGDEISLCKVQKGGSDIKDAIEAGETLLITSKD